MTIRFSQYLLESTNDIVLNEKLGNLGKIEPKYKPIIGSILKYTSTHNFKITPNSKTQTVTGTGTAELQKVLKDQFKRVGPIGCVILTVGNKTVLLATPEQDKAPGKMTKIVGAVLTQPSDWKENSGPDLPKADVDRALLMFSNQKGKALRWKDLVDEFEDTFHAIIFFKDPAFDAVRAQRDENFIGKSNDKYGNTENQVYDHLYHGREAGYDGANLRNSKTLEKSHRMQELEKMAVERNYDKIDANWSFKVDKLTTDDLEKISKRYMNAKSFYDTVIKLDDHYFALTDYAGKNIHEFVVWEYPNIVNRTEEFFNGPGYTTVTVNMVRVERLAKSTRTMFNSLYNLNFNHDTLKFYVEYNR